MKIQFLTTFVAVLGVFAFTSTAPAAEDKKGEDPKQTAQEKEIAGADKLIDDKLSPYQKGQLTRLVNSGDAKELAELPGIGKATAKRIIDARPLKSSAHLVTIKGIGLKTMAKIVAHMAGDGKKKSDAKKSS